MQVAVRQYIDKFEAIFWKNKAEHLFSPIYMFLDFKLFLGSSLKLLTKPMIRIMLVYYQTLDILRVIVGDKGT